MIYSVCVIHYTAYELYDCIMYSIYVIYNAYHAINMIYSNRIYDKYIYIYIKYIIIPITDKDTFLWSSDSFSDTQTRPIGINKSKWGNQNSPKALFLLFSLIKTILCYQYTYLKNFLFLFINKEVNKINKQQVI